MERLNEILGRTSPRQSQRSAQRPYQESVPEEQARDTRDGQAQIGRQGSDEPTTRPVHRYPSFMQNGQPRYQAAPHPESSDLSQPTKSAYSHYRNAQAPINQDAHVGERARTQRVDADAHMHYRHQNILQQDARRPHLPQPQYSQMDSGTDYQLQNRSHYEEPRIESLPPRQTTDFSNKNYPRTGQPRRADDYAPSLRADALDEWEVGGMGYGDWEKDDPDAYEEEEIQIIEDDEASPSIYQVYPPRSMNAETPAAYAPIDLPRKNQQRDYREYDGYEQYPSLPRASQPTTPSSTYQHAPQEQEYQQRMTQPLDPQMVTDIQRESRSPQAAQPVQPVQSTDQRILRALRKTAPEKRIEPIKLPETIDVVSAPKAPCPLCHGAGYLRANVPFGHPNFGKPVQCECKEAEQRDKRRQQLREMSNMDSFRDHTFKTFRNSIIGVKEAYQVAVEFANEPDGWLLLVGPNGCGKTHLAAAIANQQLLRGGVVLFEAVPDLLDHLRAAFAPTATEVYDQLFSKMREAELLILDDLGAQQSSPWANEKLFQLLNYRYNMGAPTVITANPRGMTAVDERVRSRLNDHSLVRQVSMDHVRDYRPNNTRKR
jgi:DNA replication protein DnaC